MNLDRFVAERDPMWRELDRLTGFAKGKPERLGPQALLRLGDLYRAAAADLAFARRRWPSDPVVPRLAQLVDRARLIVYDAPPQRGTMRSFFAHEYWRRVRERPHLLILATVFLLGPLLLTALWSAQDPGAAANFVPEGFQSVTEPKTPGQDLGLSRGEEALVSSQIFTNNIQVTFLAFALGALAGVGTALILGYNGVFIGAIAGLAFDAGNGAPFTELVVAHGILELSCIVVTGAAGLRIGWALVAPGHKPRLEAVTDEARRGVEIVLGTIPWLVLAGLVEGFVTPAGLGLLVNSIVGVALGAVYWGFVLRSGRRTSASDATDHNLALAFARR
jgi:uncharacterized membrane protein SpoIIM required for sporulation